MNHLDLFSGIGGFTYAVDQVWPGSTHTFCDNNLFCQKVLAKHWPESEIYGDIRSYTEKAEFDLLTGGFPCQPFSQAGKRRGTEDDRYLWPEMLRVIQLTNPTWIIGENVGGLVTWNEGMVLEQVCLDLENEGYEVQPFIIPACAVNAPHRRDRVWIVANRTGRGNRPKQERDRPGEPKEKVGNGNSHAKDTISQRSGRGMEDNRQVLERQSPEIENARPGWEKNWIEVAAELCSLDDGLPVELDGFKLTKSGHRTEQLKAYGNAIVPQVAIEIMKAIKHEK